jgi:hypothetical protein
VQWDGAPLVLAAADTTTWSAALESDRVTPGLHRVTVTAAGQSVRLDDLLLEIR